MQDSSLHPPNMPQRGSNLGEAPTFELVIPTAMTLLSPDCINVPAGALCAPLIITRWAELVTSTKLFFFQALKLGTRQGVGEMIPMMRKDGRCCYTVTRFSFRGKDPFSHAETSRVTISDTVEVKKGVVKKLQPWPLHTCREPQLRPGCIAAISLTLSLSVRCTVILQLMAHAHTPPFTAEWRPGTCLTSESFNLLIPWEILLNLMTPKYLLIGRWCMSTGTPDICARVSQV